ncbi:GNAT family N-acetyltransferase [Salirhabdus salicampi]|uniref:GNAT family N-acetyltransferase n=1 Tax=Salirhabdus salicampi TaxID=476102 RepID=UPI0020C4AA7F|nr:GNAT family N-acetyltransferase [Salirhabdus salicampi]MCP8616101.1 GNAT family N-acetyltransferase [Salirhabdus salicampi]
MYKEFYVFDKQNKKPKKALIRNYTINDFPALIQVQKEAFPPPFPSDLWWNEDQLNNHVKQFSDGALCIEIDGQIVGSMTGLMVEFDMHHLEHTWEEITDNGYIRNHNPNGNTLYVVDICISPRFRSLGLGKHLMQSMYEVVVHLRLERLLGGGRMPNYHKYVNSLNASQYVEEVVAGNIYDQVITFLLKCGRTPVAPVPNYLEDEESCHYGLLMEWKNPFS